jgi:hypothetical protein
MQTFQDRSCTSSQCHGGAVPRNEPRLDPTDLYGSWAGLRAFTLSAGRGYLPTRPGDPIGSGMYCHLRGQCGVSMLPMIPGNALSPQELAAADAWLACGAPFN